MEVGSFLGAKDLARTNQLCSSGVGFVEHHRLNRTALVLLHLLIPCCRFTRWSLVKRICARRVAQECIQRIELFLSRARRTNLARVIFGVKLKGDCVTNREVFVCVHRHFQQVSYLQSNSSRGLAIAWRAGADSIADVAFLLGPTRANSGQVLAIAPGSATSPMLLKLNLGNSSVSDLSPFVSCEALHTLNLCVTQVRDVSALGSCEALHTLNLSYNPLVNDVSALAACQALHTLNLTSTGVSVVSVLASCQSLHTLKLNGTRVSDVSALASLQSLYALHLVKTQVSNVSALASCQSLHTLELSGTQVSDVSALASCQSLHTLILRETQVRDVSVVAAFQTLHKLDLSNTRVSDVSALASCPSLYTLRLCGSQVSDVSALALSQSLYHLNVYRAQVSDVSALVSCPSLRWLDGAWGAAGYDDVQKSIRLRIERLKFQKLSKGRSRDSAVVLV
jgi:hypothetical protein